MNPHFRQGGNAELTTPVHAYARFDQMEPYAGASHLVLAFDLVDADWLDGQRGENPLFDLHDTKRCAEAWQNWNAGESRDYGVFDDMPLFRMELDLLGDQGLFGQPAVQNPEITASLVGAAAMFEELWFELTISLEMQTGYHTALLYPSLFSAPTPIYVCGALPSPRKAGALDRIFSLSNLPTLSKDQMVSALELAGVTADYLAVYDVGQGNANALLRQAHSGEPGPVTLYYDLGAGVYKNIDTTPKPLIFDFTEAPMIVLSHWDADHWAGAYVSSVNGVYPALALTWIAPVQSVGPLHVVFAHEVRGNGGTFYQYRGAHDDVGSARAAGSKRLRFVRGQGTDRNNGGLVLLVEDLDYTPPKSWLLTGDCDYLYFTAALNPIAPIAIVVPHHGASLDQSTPVPAPPVTGYKRLIYSFGPLNRQGPNNVAHPTQDGLDVHIAADWDHCNWDLLQPQQRPGGDILATSLHLDGTLRGGALIGWDEPDKAFTAPPYNASLPPLIQS